MLKISIQEYSDLTYSDEYANFIMTNGDPSERAICNGDTLLMAMEDLYMFEEFIASKNLVCDEV